MNKIARRKSPKGEERRRLILDVATRLFARGGFNTVSLADIANEVGLTQAGLLHHFPSKNALLMGMLEQREDMFHKSVERREQLGMNYFESFVASLRENERNPEMVQLFTILSGESLIDDNPSKDWFVNHYDQMVRRGAEEISKLIDLDKLPQEVSVEDIARAAIGLADGLRLQWLMDPNSVDRPGTITKFVALLQPYMR